MEEAPRDPITLHHEQRQADGTRCLEAALGYLRRGWSVLALCPPDHLGVGLVSKEHAKTCKSPGKRPWHCWQDYEDRLPLEIEVRGWWKRMPTSNVGIALGPVSGLIRVDVEGAAGEARLQEKSGGDLPVTLEFRSGRADGTGRGLLYKIPEGASVRTTRDSLGKGAELRLQARGAQTVLPPSRHPDGGLYLWQPGRGPGEAEVALAPDWLLKELAVDPQSIDGQRARRSMAEWEEVFGGVAKGSRNDTTAAVIGKALAEIRDLESPSALQTVWLFVTSWNLQNDPPLDDDELKTVFMSILKAEKTKRHKHDLQALDRHVAHQIEGSTDMTPEAERNGGKGQEQTPPDWHLIIIQGDPATFRLRSPYWSDSPHLKDKHGYVDLTDDQILNWTARGSSIPRAAFKQALAINTPLTLKGWGGPDGFLAKLLAHADRVHPVTEAKRPLYVLAFIYRYAALAAELEPDPSGDLPFPRSGSPCRTSDGTAYLKLHKLKQAASKAREDFKQSEITSLLSSFATPAWPDRTRWWRITPESLQQIAQLTSEILT